MRSRNWSILLLKLEPQGKQVWYLWKKSQFITPVEEMSTYYLSPCLSVYSQKQPVVQPTCNFYTRRGPLCPVVSLFLSNGLQQEQKRPVSSNFIRGNIPRLLLVFPLPASFLFKSSVFLSLSEHLRPLL